ncbi:MAG: enoyl-CoA hydratase/isomerase family protein [Deltaproteobacteria bacterium]|nr:enoyl-CoA hydratase/isomerase family protein [Deltaproteobacteria bacterium]MBW2339866.1 enoyl-CoA hydratase/isomerase family protein [Deltaproteobacteria bacterium]
MQNLVKLDVIEGIARVTLNRPKVFNAFGLTMIQNLAEKLIGLAMDKRVRGVIITGEGRAFCAGADLKWVSDFGNPSPYQHHSRLLARRDMG